MELKIFGKKLFEINKNNNPRSVIFVERAIEQMERAEFVPDFMSWNMDRANASGLVAWTDPTEGPLGANAITAISEAQKKVVEVDGKHYSKPSPKHVYQAKMLNDLAFRIKVDPKYVDEQVQHFKDKLNLLKLEEFERTNSLIEIQSILMRMQNRKKYEEHRQFFDGYPYTTTSRIAELVKEHNHLELGSITQFLPDMPQEAVDAMKGYNETVKKICGKKAVYYLIAKKEDFKKTDSRKPAKRDPILLAQSPFGHFWQILGAWDEEMLLLDEL